MSEIRTDGAAGLKGERRGGGGGGGGGERAGPLSESSSVAARWSTRANPCFPSGESRAALWINVPFAVTVYFQTNVSIEASARAIERGMLTRDASAFSFLPKATLLYGGSANTKIFSRTSGNIPRINVT